jgi:hypothetical protein
MEFRKEEMIDDAGAWIGPQIQDDPIWVHQLSDSAIAEIDDALANLHRIGASIPFGAEAFPLPTFAAKLDKILVELEHGRGFQLLRGLPRDRYTDDDCALIYWGIGVHFGNPVSQNARGHRLGHVRDEGRSYDDPNARGYQTSQRMDFHCDLLPIDVLGLFCLRTAKSGGVSALVSALTVHNVLSAERLDLLEATYGLFNVDWRSEEPEGEQPWFSIPMFSERDGKVSARFCSRPYYESVSRYGETLKLTYLQREALDKVQEIANRPELRLSMSFQEGDIQLINNHMIMHAREAFEDYEEDERKRHLLRMWIGVPDDQRRPLSNALSERYRWVKAGGIPLKPETTT